MSETSTQSMSVASLAIVGILLLAVIALSNTLLRGVRLDLTENKLYTLSEGSRAILGKLDEPINLYFFYSKRVAQGLPSIHNYGKRVREMLEEMAEAAAGKLELKVIDPEPFSDEEDRAVQLGVQAVPLSGGNETLYFGLAASNAVGENAVIPYFSTDRQSLLEYDLSKLIYQLNQAKKPVVGLLSSLNVSGGFDPQRMQATSSWIVFEQLEQFFEVRKLETEMTSVPDDVDLLVIVHPSGLQGSALYAIDQFVLGGGNALVFVDPYAESAQGSVMRGAPTIPTNSELKPLLETWGVRMRANEVLGDAQYALRVSYDPSKAPAHHYAILGMRADSLNQDDVITRGLDRINIGFGGILEPIEKAETDFIPLIRSSDKAMAIPSFKVQPGSDPVEIQRSFRPTGKTYVLAARISGKVNSAYPGGPPPANEDSGGEDEQGDSGEQQENKDNSNKAITREHISASKESINVVIFGDSDLLTDRMWVQVEEFFGRRIAAPVADNADLVINAVDNLLGSSDLISIRSRASYARPFERVDELRFKAESQFRAKEQELQTRLRETEQKISDLQQQKGAEGSAMILSVEQNEAIKGFQQELLETRKELRNVQHELNRNIETLGTVLKFINIVLVPILLSLGVIIFIFVRRKRTRAALELGGGV